MCLLVCGLLAGSCGDRPRPEADGGGKVAVQEDPANAPAGDHPEPVQPVVFYINNDSPDRWEVGVNGEARAHLPPYHYRKYAINSGENRLRIAADGNVVCDDSVTLPAGKMSVFSPLGTSRFYIDEIHYSASFNAPAPRRNDLPAGRLVSAQADWGLDHEVPDTINIKGAATAMSARCVRRKLCKVAPSPLTPAAAVPILSVNRYAYPNAAFEEALKTVAAPPLPAGLEPALVTIVQEEYTQRAALALQALVGAKRIPALLGLYRTVPTSRRKLFSHVLERSLKERWEPSLLPLLELTMDDPRAAIREQTFKAVLPHLGSRPEVQPLLQKMLARAAAPGEKARMELWLGNRFGEQYRTADLDQLQRALRQAWNPVQARVVFPKIAAMQKRSRKEWLAFVLENFGKYPAPARAGIVGQIRFFSGDQRLALIETGLRDPTAGVRFAAAECALKDRNLREQLQDAIGARSDPAIQRAWKLFQVEQMGYRLVKPDTRESGIAGLRKLMTDPDGEVSTQAFAALVRMKKQQRLDLSLVPEGRYLFRRFKDSATRLAAIDALPGRDPEIYAVAAAGLADDSAAVRKAAFQKLNNLLVYSKNGELLAPLKKAAEAEPDDELKAWMQGIVRSVERNLK